MGRHRQIGLIFHGIGTPARELEDGEASYWISIAQFESILDRIARDPDPGRFRISFDDGNLSDHDIALPRLLERGLTADVFVLSGRLDRPGSLARDHVWALQQSGMTIGSHGVAHLDWRRIDDAALAVELRQSRQVLEEVCKRPVDTAGIPFGSYNARVLRALRKAGYVAAYTSDRGTMDSHAYLRPRTSVRNEMGAADIETVLQGRLAPYAHLRRAVGGVRKRLF